MPKSIAEFAVIGNARATSTRFVLAGDWLDGLLKKPTPFGGRTEKRTDEALHLKVEFHDHAVGTARESETGTDVVLESVGQLTPHYGEYVVLLLTQRIIVIDESDAAVELDAGREVPRQAIVGAVAIAELEA
jgi:hypothetical protein